MWKFLGPYLHPYRGPLVLGILLNAISGASIAAQALMPKYLLDNVIQVHGLSLRERIIRLIIFTGGYLVLVIIFRMLFWHASYRLFTRVREDIIFTLRSQFFRQINALCLRFHLKHSTGELYSYLFGSPLTQVQQYFQQAAMFATNATFNLLTTIVWVATWDWALALVFVVTAVLNLFLMKITKRRIKILHHNFQSTEGNVGGYVADLMRGNKAIKLHGVEPQVTVDFDFRAQLMSRKAYERDVQSHVQSMKQEAGIYAVYALLCVVCAWRYWSGHITGAEILVSLGALANVYGPLQQLFTISTMQGGAEVSLHRLEDLLKEQSSTPDPLIPEKPPMRGDLVLRGVRFSYDTEPVFDGFDLTIPYGQCIALVGPSGSGKSTLTQLLLRFYDPEQGEITLSGRDLRNYAARDLRRLFGVVPQDPYLFSTTLRDNLRLVQPEANDDRIRWACEQANAWEFIEKLPHGLDTQVGEGGATLSGGQRQRIAIARALLAEPAFFIFDEATSALDSLSERLIQESLQRILLGKTALIIAHRLSTVALCDRILVLQQGRIVQEGSYDELATQIGLFRDMVEGSFRPGSAMEE